MKKYKVYIGLEVHTELFTQSKLFCGCKTKFGAPPNTQSCPVCLGLPGVLPVLNKKAVKYTIITALALKAKIKENCRFARKNYYYPDLPKNYQISQYEKPIATGGWVKIKVNGNVKKIGIEPKRKSLGGTQRRSVSLDIVTGEILYTEGDSQRKELR